MPRERDASDLTGKARIREAAIRLFAEQGFGVSSRTIGREAGVSPALIAHHYGSREGLRSATDEAVLGRLAALLGEQPPARSLAALAERWRAVGEASEREPELLDYVARALVEGDRNSVSIFRGMRETVSAELALLESQGLVRRTPDPEMRDLMFTLLDLAPIMLREAVEEDLGAPFEGPVLERWLAVLLDLFQHGLGGPAPAPAEPGPEGAEGTGAA